MKIYELGAEPTPELIELKRKIRTACIDELRKDMTDDEINVIFNKLGIPAIGEGPEGLK